MIGSFIAGICAAYAYEFIMLVIIAVIKTNRRK